ncbi:MAG: hypothetical protein AB7D00_14950 [Rhodospirillaceae bacterium]
MTWQSLLSAVWAGLNSPIGITAMGAVVAWLLTRLFTSKPAWAKYQGAIISAVRLAEKEIPDDTPHAALRRFDEALRYVLQVYAEAEKRMPSPSEIAALKEGIRIVHNELDLKGALGSATDAE